MFSALSQLDAGILLWVQDHLRGPVQDTLVRLYSSLGDAGLLWIGLCAVLLLFRATRKAGAVGLLALLCSLLAVNLTIKPLVDRVRPYEVVEGLRPLLRPLDEQSFPSGHTSAAFAAACAWLPCLPRRWMKWGALALAVLMGLSRLYMGIHYPSDVLAGAAIGALCAWAAHLLYRWGEKRYNARRL